MKIIIELWKAKDKWMNLSIDERQTYLEQIGPVMQDMAAAGLVIVSWGYNDTGTTHRADYDFFSVMKFPNQDLLSKFEEIVEAAGWYDYFSQINVSGEDASPDAVIGMMMAL